MTEETGPVSPLPLPHLTGQRSASDAMPPAVRDARVLNLLGVVVSILLVVVYMFREGGGGANFQASTTGAALFAGLAIVQAVQMRYLKRGDPAAWRIQILLSGLGAFGFPLGTLLHLFVLGRWFTPETRAWFGRG